MVTPLLPTTSHILMMTCCFCVCVQLGKTNNIPFGGLTKGITTWYEGLSKSFYSPCCALSTCQRQLNYCCQVETFVSSTHRQNSPTVSLFLVTITLLLLYHYADIHFCIIILTPFKGVLYNTETISSTLRIHF